MSKDNKKIHFPPFYDHDLWQKKKLKNEKKENRKKQQTKIDLSKSKKNYSIYNESRTISKLWAKPLRSSTALLN